MTSKPESKQAPTPGPLTADDADSDPLDAKCTRRFIEVSVAREGSNQPIDADMRRLGAALGLKSSSV